MTARGFAKFQQARSAILARTEPLRRLARGEAGMAAVEFALILPMMLALYFGCVVLAQGLEVGRKTQALSRTLADLTAQTPAIGAAPPVLADADILNIFAASSAVLFPFSGAANMTISEVVFDNVSSGNSQCCVAKILWSVGSGPAPVLRQCATLAQSSNGVNAPGSMPIGVYPPAVANNSNGPDIYIIVADVTYSYSPGFGFETGHWNQSPNNGAGYKISQTTYMSPRNGANTAIQWTPGGAIPSTQYVTCTPNTP